MIYSRPKKRRLWEFDLNKSKPSNVYCKLQNFWDSTWFYYQTWGFPTSLWNLRILQSAGAITLFSGVTSPIAGSRVQLIHRVLPVVFYSTKSATFDCTLSATLSILGPLGGTVEPPWCSHMTQVELKLLYLQTSNCKHMIISIDIYGRVGKRLNIGLRFLQPPQWPHPLRASFCSSSEKFSVLL